MLRFSHLSWRNDIAVVYVDKMMFRMLLEKRFSKTHLNSINKSK